MTTADIAKMLSPLQFAQVVVHHDPDNPKYPIVIALHLSAATVMSMDPALLDRTPSTVQSPNGDASRRVRRKHRPGHLSVERGDG